jgi:hypothetical protein
MPSRRRPPETSSTEAAAPAVIAGWRVARFVTQAARPTRAVRVAASVSATHDVHRVARRVGDAEEIPAVALGQSRHAHRVLRRPRPEEKAEARRAHLTA